MKTIVIVLALGRAAFAQTTLNMSEDLVSLGIASSNMLPGRPDLDAGPLFTAAIRYAQAHHIARVIADTGAYYIQSLQYAGAHVAWDGLSDLTIDLQGSDLYFSHPLVQGILITNATNIVVQNFTMDYNPLPFTQVRVVSVDPVRQQIQFAVDGNWQNPTVLNAVFPVAVFGFGIEIHIFRNGRPIPNVTRMSSNNPVGSSQFTATPDPGIVPRDMFAQIRPGDIAFLGMRAGSGPFSVLYCTGCTFRNLAVYSGTEWGFLAAQTQSTVFERIYSVPRPGTDRLASNFVGLLLTDQGPGNQVRLNRTFRSMDDGLEYNTSFIGFVKSQMDSRTFLLEGPGTSRLSYGEGIPNGTAVSFQRLSDGAIAASALVVSQNTLPPAGQIPQVTYTFDRDLPPSIAGTLMFSTDLSLRAGNAVLERNAMEEETDCCTGMSVSGLLSGVFRGNYILRAGMSALHVGNSLQTGNFILPPSASVTVNNNTIDSANWADSSYILLQLASVQIETTNAPFIVTGSPNQNIDVTNNFIVDSGSPAVWLGNTNGGSVSGNTLLNSNINPAVESAVSFFGPAQQPIVLKASQNIINTNNVIDQTWRRMWVTDAQYRELAAYAPASNIRLNAYALATLYPPPAVTLTDADGNTAALTVEIVTPHALDVQIPASAALGGAHLTLTSGSVKYYGTLFLDSAANIPALNGCTYEMSPSAQTAASAKVTLPILVITQSGCPYQVLSSAAFVTPGAGGSGTGLVSPSFAANTGALRTAVVEVAGQVITITQAATSAAAQPASIKSIGGDGQTGLAGFMLPNPIVVEVRDNLGNPVPQALVSFAGVNAGVNPASVPTDALGRAGALITPAAAGAVKVTAAVGTLAPVTFNLTAIQATSTVAIQKTWQAASGASPLRGDAFTYSIKVTNTGNTAAAAVTVQDTPDTRAELAMQGPLTFNLGALAPGVSQTVSITAAAAAAGVYVNNASVTWSDIAGKVGNATTAATTAVARQAGDFATTLNAPISLGAGVRQVRADGQTVYVVNNPGDSLTILNCASGACKVASTVDLGAGANPVAVTTLDVDGDGIKDVLVLNQGTGSIAALLSSSPGAPQVSNIGASPIAFAPFQAGDGMARIAVAFAGVITIFAWDGQRFQPMGSVSGAAIPSALINADFNGDGPDDLLLADSAADTVQLMLGDGAGGLKPGSVISLGATNPVALAVGDVDNSGSLDAAVITSVGVVILLGDGAGNLTPLPVISVAGAGDVALGDFNGDGNLDLAVANHRGSSVSLYRGDGSGSFVGAGSYLTGNAPVSLAVSDLNRDGRDDLICGNSGSKDLAVLLFTAQ